VRQGSSITWPRASHEKRTASAVGLSGTLSLAPSPKEFTFLLVVKPAEELLKARIGLDLLNRVKRVPQFVMRPCFVNEILTGMAGRSDVSSAFAPRHDMMPSRGHLF
jgi:hypothetical protein